jgi:hypothetical protein
LNPANSSNGAVAAGRAPAKRRSGSARASAKDLRELRTFMAGLVRQRYASDDYYDKLLVIYERVETDLRNRDDYQRLARSKRYQRDPEAFCRLLWGIAPKDWQRRFVDSPSSVLTVKKVQTLRVMLARDPEALTHPEMFQRYDASSLDKETTTVLRLFQSLAARPAGRKRTKADLYARGLELQRAGGRHRPTIHQIVMKLNPDYAKMSAVERRAERDRWQAGIARARQREIAEGRRGSTKSPV